MTDVRRLTYAWVLLSAITIGTWWVGHASHTPETNAHAYVTVAAMGLAAVKVQLIVRHFMEVRNAPMWLRISTTTWLVVVVGVILTVYFW